MPKYTHQKYQQPLFRQYDIFTFDEDYKYSKPYTVTQRWRMSYRKRCDDENRNRGCRRSREWRDNQGRQNIWPEQIQKSQGQSGDPQRIELHP